MKMAFNIRQLWIRTLLTFTFVTQLVQARILEYQILEELPKDTAIANIVEDANFRRKYNSDQISSLTFSMTTQPDMTKQSYFHIDESSGILSMQKVLDREEICPFMLICDIKITVLVGPNIYFEQIEVDIEVMDINDNTPTFPQSSLHLYILESTLPGASYPIPAASDRDVGVFGVQRYRLMPEPESFEIKTRAGVDGTTEVELLVRSPGLDRELITQYEFQIIAYDGGSPAKSDSMLLNITIGDTNDNVPVFTKSEYTVAIQEDAAVPTTIVQVHANDMDFGNAGLVSYSFTPKTFTMYGSMFSIDSATGEIKLTNSLDYETQNEYSLTVSAKDGERNSRPAFALVIVRVLDVNDYAPQIAVNILTGGPEAQISENSPSGTFVAHISVMDRDSGNNGNVQCSLINAGFFALSDIQYTQYKVITIGLLDREKKDSYTITIECEDSGSPALKSSRDLTIKVTDFNDNAPEFTQNVYTEVITENNPINAYVIQVNATDKDLGINADISYELSGIATQYFTIDSKTGVIRAKKVLNYEAFHEIEFPVVARDGGTPSLFSEAKLKVVLLDVNDSPPKFTLLTYTFVVMENMDAGSYAGQVSASDEDSAPYNYIKYDIHVSDLDKAEIFHMDRDTGSMSTKMKLDREAISSYTFRVIATNEGYPDMTSTATVHIYVDDQNDNDPLITFPNVNNYTVPMYGLAGVGEIVTQVKATDLDVGANGKLSYMLKPAPGGSSEDVLPFDIDTNTGTIILTKEAESLDNPVYNLSIHVIDHGIPPRMASSMLKVSLNQSLYYARYPYGSSGAVSGPNMMIVIVVVSVSGVLMLLLLAAIAWVVYRNRKCQRVPEEIATYDRKYQYPKLGTFEDDHDGQTETKVETELNGGFDEHQDNNFNRKLSSTRDPSHFHPHHSADSGYEDHVDIFTVQGQNKHVTFRLSPVPTSQQQKTAHQERKNPLGGPGRKRDDNQQEIDRASTSSNEGSNTDSGCILADENGGAGGAPSQHSPLGEKPPIPPPLPRRDSDESLPPQLPPRMTIREVKAKDRLKRNGPLIPGSYGQQGSSGGLHQPSQHHNQNHHPQYPHNTSQQPPNMDFAYNIPDVIHSSSSNFSDASSLMRYKQRGEGKCASEATDNTSTTSGSYVIDPSEMDSSKPVIGREYCV